jgi:hypothetical protein
MSRPDIIPCDVRSALLSVLAQSLNGAPASQEACHAYLKDNTKDETHPDGIDERPGNVLFTMRRIANLAGYNLSKEGLRFENEAQKALRVEQENVAELEQWTAELAALTNKVSAKASALSSERYSKDLDRYLRREQATLRANEEAKRALAVIKKAA